LESNGWRIFLLFFLFFAKIASENHFYFGGFGYHNRAEICSAFYIPIFFISSFHTFYFFVVIFVVILKLNLNFEDFYELST